MNITRRLFKLAAPIVGLNSLNVLSLAVDTAMCGRLPDAQVVLTALGFATQVVFLLMVAMMGLTVGTVALVARAHGADDSQRVEHVLRQSVLLTIGLGILAATVGNLLAPQVLSLLGASDKVVDVALEYLRPLLLGTTFNYLVLLFAAVLRGVGNTRLPFLISIGANAINVFLNYGFILGNMGFPALGIFGAALGTVASQLFGTSVLLWSIRRGVIVGVGLPFSVRLDVDLIRTLVRIGTPAAIDMVILNAAFLSIIGMLGRIDEVAVAAHGIGLRIQALAFVPGMSVSQATGAMVGQALGARDIPLARAVLRSSVLLGTLLMSSVAAVIVVFAVPIVGIFDVAEGTALHDYTIQWMLCLGYGMPLVGVWIAFVGLLQGAGFTILSLRINFLSTVLFQIPLSWLLGFPLGYGTLGVWIAFPIAFLLKGALGYLAYRKGEWARIGKDV